MGKERIDSWAAVGNFSRTWSIAFFGLREPYRGYGR